MSDTPDYDWRRARAHIRNVAARHRLAQAAPPYVPPPGAYAVANYLMVSGPVLQVRWYERTGDITLAIMPAEEGAA
jgi:hypothetical protein